MRLSLIASEIAFALSTTAVAVFSQSSGPSIAVPLAVYSVTTTAQAQGGPEDTLVTAMLGSETLRKVTDPVSEQSASQSAKQGVFKSLGLNRALFNLQSSSPYGDRQPNFSVRRERNI